MFFFRVSHEASVKKDARRLPPSSPAGHSLRGSARARWMLGACLLRERGGQGEGERAGVRRRPSGDTIKVVPTSWRSSTTTCFITPTLDGPPSEWRTTTTSGCAFVSVHCEEVAGALACAAELLQSNNSNIPLQNITVFFTTRGVSLVGPHCAARRLLL